MIFQTHMQKVHDRSLGKSKSGNQIFWGDVWEVTWRWRGRWHYWFPKFFRKITGATCLLCDNIGRKK